MLNVYNTKSGRFTTQPLLIKGSVSKSPVWALYMDEKGRFWIGTEQGLLLYDPQIGTCVKLPVERCLNEKGSLWVRAITRTRDGAIWLGTSEQGVCRITESASGDMWMDLLFFRLLKIQSASFILLIMDCVVTLSDV